MVCFVMFCFLCLLFSFLKLGNIKFLDTAREHLNSAQFALELAHGPNMERLVSFIWFDLHSNIFNFFVLPDASERR